jgi:hypothetical protein
MKFTREQKADALDNLPKDLKAVLMSNTLANTFQEIGNQNKLPIDKTGALSELVIVTMLGLLPRQDFEKNVRAELGVDNVQASLITKSVNENVFLKVREILQKEEDEIEVAETPKEEEVKETPNDFPDLNKDDLLAEIENPAPTVHPISIVDQTIPGPAKPREVVAAENAAHDFISEKLSSSVSLPSQKINIVPPKPTPVAKDKKYTADPYREPIS